MLGVSSVPTSLKSCFQKPPMNWLSLSLTMVLGKPCSLKTSLKNKYATCVAEILEGMEKKWANFVSLSTSTHISLKEKFKLLISLCLSLKKTFNWGIPELHFNRFTVAFLSFNPPLCFSQSRNQSTDFKKKLSNCLNCIYSCVFTLFQQLIDREFKFFYFAFISV